MRCFATRPVEEVQRIKGVVFPARIGFGQLLISGPPGAGKSTLVARLGGWPEEGYIDLTAPRWWSSPNLLLRPREIHLGIPFVGFSKPLAVFDRTWLSRSPMPEVDFTRLRMPPKKRHLLAVDWYKRYVFEFLLPTPEELLARRLERSRQYTHPVDEMCLTLETVSKQLQVYEQIALFFHRQGLQVYLRERIDGPPLQIVDTGD